MLKKIILSAAVAVGAVSCNLDGPAYSNSYTMYADFEYGNVFQSDSIYVETKVGSGIGYQDMAFYHKLSADKDFEGGFILSRLKGSGSSNLDRYRVNSGTGFNKTSSYMVYYANPNPTLMPKTDIEFLSSQHGTCGMIGCYVNNTKEVVEAVKKNFVVGDRLAIKMTGYLAGEKTGEQEFVLAEFTEKKDSIVTAWSPFELDKLGNVETIDIEVTSTRDIIPAAFCMDLMVAKISVSY